MHSCGMYRSTMKLLSEEVHETTKVRQLRPESVNFS